MTTGCRLGGSRPQTQWKQLPWLLGVSATIQHTKWIFHKQMYSCGLGLHYNTCKTKDYCGLRPLFIYAMSIKEWQSSRILFELPARFWGKPFEDRSHMSLNNRLFIYHWSMCKAVYTPACVLLYPMEISLWVTQCVSVRLYPPTAAQAAIAICG